MLFFSNFFSFGSSSIKKIENQAKDVLELSNELKAYRLGKDIVIIDSSKNKIISRTKDVFPKNSTRAILEISNLLNIANNNTNNDKKDIWTCGFRDSEARWVWYRNSEPVITASYEEVFKNGSIEDKLYFFSARYGTVTINRIKEIGLEKVAKEINALILDNPYVKVACSSCTAEENYTIDDIVDKNKIPNYSSNFVVCQHCNETIKLQ